MTTIASDGKIVITDSSVSDEDQVWSVAKAELVSGTIYATSGGASDGEKFMNWVKRGKRGKKPVVAESFSAMALNEQGVFLFDSELYPMRLKNFHAIGSGAKAARGAFEAGATIERAVEIACGIDAGSRLPLQIYTLEGDKK